MGVADELIDEEMLTGNEVVDDRSKRPVQNGVSRTMTPLPALGAGSVAGAAAGLVAAALRGVAAAVGFLGVSLRLGAGGGSDSASFSWTTGCSGTAGATAAGAASGDDSPAAEGGGVIAGLACAGASGAVASRLLGPSFTTAMAATAATANRPKTMGPLLLLRRPGGYVSSSGDEIGEEATGEERGAGAMMGAAAGAVRICPGMV